MLWYGNDRVSVRFHQVAWLRGLRTDRLAGQRLELMGNGKPPTSLFSSLFRVSRIYMRYSHGYPA